MPCILLIRVSKSCFGKLSILVPSGHKFYVIQVLQEADMCLVSFQSFVTHFRYPSHYLAFLYFLKPPHMIHMQYVGKHSYKHSWQGSQDYTALRTTQFLLHTQHFSLGSSLCTVLINKQKSFLMFIKQFR